MAVARDLDQVTVMLDRTTGAILEVQAITFIVGVEQGVMITQRKSYAVPWDDLGPAAQQRVTDFVTDVNGFINTLEPVT